MLPWNSVSLLVVLLVVSVMATRPVNALITLRTVCLRITAMHRNRFLVLKFRSPYQITKSAFTLSSLIEFALRDFVVDIYEVDHNIYMGTVVKINESDNEVLVFFMEPSVVFKSNSQTFRWPKKLYKTWLKKYFSAVLNSSSTGDKVRLQIWWWLMIQNIHRECKNVI